MEHIGAHLSSGPRKRDKATERGELMRYFMLELNKGRRRDGLTLLTMPRMGKIFELIPTKDLYYLKSVCDDAASRGHEFSKRFWWELKPREEAKGAGRVIVKIEKPAKKAKKPAAKKKTVKAKKKTPAMAAPAPAPSEAPVMTSPGPLL